MMNRMPKKTFVVMIMFFLLAGFLLPSFASAANPVTAFVDWAVTQTILKVGTAILYFVGNLLAFVSRAFSSFINWQDFQHVEVVRESWKLLRDFVNMFFILILIVLAFGTIFQVSGYDVRNNPGLIGIFIISALLINFSFAIGTIIIGFAQVISKVFISAIGDFGTNVAAGLSIQKFYTSASITGSFLELVFSLIVLIVLLLSMTAALIFSVIRVPILWGLLIASPAVWILRILPSTNKVWKEYWQMFFSWTFFLPVYLLILTIITSILNAKNAIGVPQSADLSFGSFLIQDLFFYVLVVFAMLWGIKQSLNIGGMTSHGVGTAFQWADAKAKQYFPGANIAAGAKQAAVTAGKRVQQEGLLGIGGQRRYEQGVAKWAERFGVAGAREKQLNKDVSDYKEQFKSYSIQELQRRSVSGSTPQRLAALEALNDRGQLNPQQMGQAYQTYINAGAFASASRFGGGINYKDLSKDERDELFKLFQRNQDGDSIRKIAKVMAEKGDHITKDLDETVKNIKALTRYFVTDGDRLDIINKSKKRNMLAAVMAQDELNLIKKDGIVLHGVEARNEEILKSGQRLKVDDLLEYSPSNLAEIVKPSSPMYGLIREKLKNKGVQESFTSRASEEQMEAVKTLIEEINKENLRLLNDQRDALEREVREISTEVENMERDKKSQALIQAKIQQLQAKYNKLEDIKQRISELPGAPGGAAPAGRGGTTPAGTAVSSPVILNLRDKDADII